MKHVAQSREFVGLVFYTNIIYSIILWRTNEVSDVAVRNERGTQSIPRTSVRFVHK